MGASLSISSALESGLSGPGSTRSCMNCGLNSGRCHQWCDRRCNGEKEREEAQQIRTLHGDSTRSCASGCWNDVLVLRVQLVVSDTLAGLPAGVVSLRLRPSGP